VDKRKKALTVLLSIAVLVSLTLACMPGLPGGGTTEEETPAPPPPGETAAPAETPEPPPPPEEVPFELDVEAVESLSSYAYTLHIDGLSNMEGEAEEVVLDIEGQRQSQPTKAEQLSFSSVTDGDSTSMETIYIEEQGKMWVREGGDAWEEIPVMDDSMLQIFDSFSMLFWWETFFADDPEDAQYLGQEMMNGVQSHHYRTTEGTAWGAFIGGCTLASLEDDIWVAVDGSFPVKREFDASVNCQDESGEVHFLMEIRNVNQPVNINAPM
jgi:hypothetical protein